MNVERLYLDVLAGRKLDKVAERVLGIARAGRAAGGTGAPRAKTTGRRTSARRLERSASRIAIWSRSMNLAARKTAQPGLADRVLAYLEAGGKPSRRDGWKALQYQLLVALDRPKELAARAASVDRAGDARQRLALTLGHLQAETGRIAEAIATLRGRPRRPTSFAAADYRTLADWYMVVDRRDAYDRATDRRLQDDPTSVDSAIGSARSSSPGSEWRRLDQPPPRELDVEVPLGLHGPAGEVQPAAELPVPAAVVLRRHARLPPAGRPGRRDARATPPARSIRCCKTCRACSAKSATRPRPTALVEQIAAVRQRAKTDVDQRALDLLEMLVERRAAELQNQPGPHRDRALAALRGRGSASGRRASRG